MSYSKDLRNRVMSYVRGGGSKAEAAALFSVSRSQVYVWLRQGASYSIGKPGPKKNRKVDAEQLASAISSCPDTRIKELGERFGVHESTISKALKRLGIVRKKNTSLPRKHTP